MFIFDGAHPDLKADEMADRRARREAAESAWQAALDAGDYATAQKLGPRVVRYTPEMVEETMELLRLLGMTCLTGRCGRRGPGRDDGTAWRSRRRRLHKIGMRFSWCSCCGSPSDLAWDQADTVASFEPSESTEQRCSPRTT